MKIMKLVDSNITNKKLLTTTGIINSSFCLFSEKPTAFPEVRIAFTKLVA
jgi:hypothetical protein